jgi:hypothetical protein
MEQWRALDAPAPEFAVERDGSTILSLRIDSAVADGKRFKAGETVWQGGKGVYRYTADVSPPGHLIVDEQLGGRVKTKAVG